MHDIYIRTPYHVEFIEDLKYDVPAHARQWHKDKRLWSVSIFYRRPVVKLLIKHFGEYETIDPADMGLSSQRQRQEQSAPPPRKPTLFDSYAALYLVPNTPIEIVTVMYRYLAKQHHPDRGGDTATMQRINAAYEAIKKDAAGK